MAKHTPGPWTIGVSSPDIPEALCIRDPSGWGVAHVFGIGENAVRDARLIAAAPDLLAALKDTVTLLDGPIADLLTGDSMDETGAYDVLTLLRAAIAKAEGNTP